MNQLSSITPLEIILIGSAAVGVFLFFRACWRNIKRSRQHLSVALLTLMMSFTAQTAWADDSGSCGEGVNYTYIESTNTLTISGNGAMTDFASYSAQPWASYRKDITKLVIEDGITHIGNYAFILFKASKVTKVTIPASVTSIGQYAFASYGSKVTFAEGSLLTSIGANAFQKVGGSIDMTNCTKLTAITAENVFMNFEYTVTFPRTMTSVCKNAFKYGSKSPTIKMDCDGLLTVNGYETKEFVGTGSYDITSCFHVTDVNSSAVTMKNISFSDMGVLNLLNDNITASGSTVEYDSKTYYYGTVTLGYTGTVPTGGIVKYAVNGDYISGNEFTISGYADVTAVVVYPYADISGLTYHGGGKFIDINGTTYDTVPGGYYEIADEQDLIDLSNYVKSGSTNDCKGMTFKMTANLDFTNMPDDYIYNRAQRIVGTGNFLPIGIPALTGGSTFKGHFDGDGHCITGLRFSYTIPNFGFFGSIDDTNTLIEGVTLVNPSFIGIKNNVGGIAGYMKGGNIKNCAVVGGTIIGQAKVGGIVGYWGYNSIDASVNSIEGCTVVGTTVSGKEYVGIIVGKTPGIIDATAALTIKNCTYHNPAGLDICGDVDKYNDDYDINIYTDGGGNQQVYQVTLGKGVTATGAAYAYGNKAYYAENATVALGHNRPGYVFGGYQSKDVTITGDTFTMPTSDVSVNAIWTPDPDDVNSVWTPNPDDISIDATETEYTIKTAAGWGVFCDLLDDGVSFTGKTVKLGADIIVDRMAGSSDNKFNGTFNGDKHKLTFYYTSTEQYVAPFRYAKDCTIKNFNVDGNITTSDKYAAGIIAQQDGTVNISNCRSSVIIQSFFLSSNSDGTHAGLVAVNSSSAKLTIDGCVFDGKIISIGPTITINCGGFVGWKAKNSLLTISNSLYAPQEDNKTVITGATFARNWTMPADANCYYTQSLGEEQGTQADWLLSESKAVSSNMDKSEIVVFRREFNGGKASTICLPFEYTPAESEGTYYSFKGIELEGDEYVATMTAADIPLKPNTPYVFMPAATDTYVPVLYHGTADYDAKNLTTTSGDWTFRGTYEQLKYGSNLDGHVYGFASRDKEVDGVNVAAGEFVKAKDGAGVKPMRCYLTYKNGDEFAGARAVTRGIEENLPQSITVKFVSSTGNTTAIATLNTQTGEITIDDAWYTLSGTRLPGKPSQRGIYINKGKAVYIKH